MVLTFLESPCTHQTRLESASLFGPSTLGFVRKPKANDQITMFFDSTRPPKRSGLRQAHLPALRNCLAWRRNDKTCGRNNTCTRLWRRLKVSRAMDANPSTPNGGNVSGLHFRHGKMRTNVLDHSHKGKSGNIGW